MSFDQFNQDQILNLDYRDNNGQRLVGISMLDRPDVDIGEIARNQDSLDRIQNPAAKDSFMMKLFAPKHGEPFQAQRVFLGRNPSKSAILLLGDPNGHPRIRLLVDSLGTASLEFLDARGNVTARLPETKK